MVCLLKASLRCKSEIVGGRDGGDGGLMRWRRFGEFCGNLNNYTPCSPRVINYICGKGFLILEPSTDKGWWGERQGKRKKKEKKKRATGKGRRPKTTICQTTSQTELTRLYFQFQACPAKLNRPTSCFFPVFMACVTFSRCNLIFSCDVFMFVCVTLQVGGPAACC